MRAVGSERAEGQPYRTAVRRWLLPTDLPAAVADLPILPCTPERFADCDVIFSGLDSSVAGDVGRCPSARARVLVRMRRRS